MMGEQLFVVTVAPCKMHEDKTCAEGQVVLCSVQKRNCKVEINTWINLTLPLYIVYETFSIAIV